MFKCKNEKSELCQAYLSTIVENQNLKKRIAELEEKINPDAVHDPDTFENLGVLDNSEDIELVINAICGWIKRSCEDVFMSGSSVMPDTINALTNLIYIKSELYKNK